MTVALKAREAAGSTPRTIPGLKLWLDARRPGATLADGAAVATWYDLSGVGNNVVQATAAKKPVYRTSTTTGYLTLPGVVGNYASSPDSAALSVTGDIDIRLKVALTDWTPSSIGAFIMKQVTTGNQRAYQFYANTNGTLTFTSSSDGANNTAIATSDATAIADGATKWVRVTRASATGTTKFYLSDDGSSWSQLGTDQATTAGPIFDSSAGMSVGSSPNGLSSLAVGKFYRAQILNGIGGTVVFDADFTTTGRSFVESSSNAAVVTINGTGARESVSTIPSILFDGVDDILTGPTWNLAQPTTRYVVFNTTNPTPSSHILSSGGSTGATRQDLSIGAGTIQLYAIGQIGTTATFSAGEVALATAVANSTSSRIAKNGGTAVSGDAGTGTWESLAVGGRPAGAPLQGLVTCALVYSGAHDANTRKKIERWLGRQYAIAVAQ